MLQWVITTQDVIAIKVTDSKAQDRAHGYIFFVNRNDSIVRDRVRVRLHTWGEIVFSMYNYCDQYLPCSDQTTTTRMSLPGATTKPPKALEATLTIP